MKLRTYIEKRGHGAIAELAKGIGAYQPDVSRWASETRPIPAHWARAIETFTDGEENSQEMCDDWMRYWPELASEAA